MLDKKSVISPKSMGICAVIGTVISVVGMHSIPVIADEGVCGFHLEGRFVESAPRDSFVFSNQSNELWNIISIRIDMNESAGNLLFDTLDGGDGVEVYQPFEVSSRYGASGEAKLSFIPTLADGDQDITLNFSQFPPESKFSFTIDVDDQLTESELGQIRVSGGEISGSVLSVTLDVPEAENVTLEGVYSSQSIVSISSSDC